MQGFPDCPVCDGSSAQCEACFNRRLAVADELTALWDDSLYFEANTNE